MFFKASLHLPTRVYHDFSSNSLDFLRRFKYHPTGFWTMPTEVSDHFKTLHTFYTVDIFVKIRLAGIQSFVEAGIERIFLNLKGFSDGQVPNGDFVLSTIYPYLFEPVTQLHYQDISFPRGYKNKDFTVQWLWNAEYDVKCGGLRFTSPLEFCQSSFGDFIRHAFINSYQVNCVGSSYSDLWYIIILDYHSVPTIQLFRNLLADHAQTCPLFYDGTFCFPVGCISDYIENLFCTTLTIQLLLLLYVIASLVFLAVFYFILGNIISLSVGVLLKFASDNMDRPIIIGTLLDPVVSYQLTIQIHPVTTQAIVIIFGFRSLFMLATTWLIPYTPLQLDL